MSAGKFFLDTNIFVYTFDPVHPGKQKRSRDLVNDAVTRRTGVTSCQVVQEFYSVAFTRFPEPMSQADAYLYFANVFRPLFSVGFSPALLLKAIHLRESNELSWYDALIVSAALEADCEILYSEDFPDGRKLEGLRIENPF